MDPETNLDYVHEVCLSLAGLLKDPTIDVSNPSNRLQLTTEQRNIEREKHYSNLVKTIDCLYSMCDVSHEFVDIVNIGNELKIKHVKDDQEYHPDLQPK